VFGQNYFQGQQVAGPGAGTPVPLGEACSPDPAESSTVRCRRSSRTRVRQAPGNLTRLHLRPGVVSRILGFGSIDLRVAGRNLVTWTKYTGVDPETSLLGSASAVRGIDYFNNPQGRSYVFPSLSTANDQRDFKETVSHEAHDQVAC